MTPLKGVSLLSMDTLYSYFNSDQGRMVEMPSVNANCSARGLALIGAAMANKGSFRGTKVLSAEGWQAMHDNATTKKLFK